MVDAVCIVSTFHLAETSVGEILVTDIVALNAAFEAFIGEGQNMVHDEVGREGNRGAAQIVSVTICVVYGPVFGTVATPRGIGIPTEPRYGLPGGFQLYTDAIALADILRDILSHGVQLTCQHELVAIGHPIEIGTCRELCALVLIAYLQVVQSLGFQLCADVGLIVITGRFFMGNGIRGIDVVVGRNLPV